MAERGKLSANSEKKEVQMLTKKSPAKKATAKNTAKAKVASEKKTLVWFFLDDEKNPVDDVLGNGPCLNKSSSGKTENEIIHSIRKCISEEHLDSGDLDSIGIFEFKLVKILPTRLKGDNRDIFEEAYGKVG